MKVAVVTGSTRGIGKGIATRLEEAGYTVVRSGTRREPPEEIRGKIYIPCDISRDEDRKALIGQTVERFGRLDLLVNNAGVAPEKRMDILETTPESFDRVLSINLRGTFFLCQLAAREMILELERVEDYHPRIVNIGSMSAYVSSTSRGEYCISKAGVGMVTALFADRLAEYGIPVFEIRPGIIDTDMTQVVHGKYQALIEQGLTPIRRFGTPDDVAKMVMACAEGYLDYSAGQVLNADGGFSLRRL